VPDDLPSVYTELRDRVRIHIKQIRKSQKKHPEYAVALLIAIASEALSKLRGQADYTVFAKELLGEKWGVKEQVGRGLFEAVRHGLAHRYNTSLIAVGKHDAVVVITWKRPERHLRVLVKDWLKDGVRRPGIYLDMDTMWKELDSFLRRMTTRIREEKKLARLVTRRGRWLDQKYTVRPNNTESRTEWLQVWKAFLDERGGATI
jgi:hypothetical protein